MVETEAQSKPPTHLYMTTNVSGLASIHDD
jgi:hypothetical protein